MPVRGLRSKGEYYRIAGGASSRRPQTKRRGASNDGGTTSREPGSGTELPLPNTRYIEDCMVPKVNCDTVYYSCKRHRFDPRPAHKPRKRPSELAKNTCRGPGPAPSGSKCHTVVHKCCYKRRLLPGLPDRYNYPSRQTPGQRNSQSTRLLLRRVQTT